MTIIGIKMNKKSKFITISLISFLIMLSIITPYSFARENKIDKKNQYHIRILPININGNSDLIGETGRQNGVIKGQGTNENPYVISGWQIDCYKLIWQIFTPKCDTAIWLQKVDKHVIIEKNYLCNSFTLWDDHWNDGIILDDCSNITIRNNSIDGIDVGIGICDSSNSIALFNEINSCYAGIVSTGIKSGKPSIITKNKVSYCGDGIRCIQSNAEIYKNEILINIDGIVCKSDNSFIHDNYIYESHDIGITCLNTDSFIENNEITYSINHGIFIYGRAQLINRNTIEFNKYSGIYIAVGNPRIENNTISNNQAYGINCIDNHDNVYFSHNLIQNNTIGIVARNNAVIYYNIISFNSEYGIFAGSSVNSKIQYNNIEGNSWGLFRSGMMPWINATNNWWGSADGPSGDGSGSGDPVSYQAIYTPWLTQRESSAGPVP